jgi:long-chain acyl-CoA synthetase
MLLRRWVDEKPGAEALVDGAVRWTWSDLEARVAAFSRGLARTGLARDDRVVLQAPTSADFVVMYLGALRAGLVVTPVNPGYTVPELTHILRDSGARMLITSSVSAIEAAHQLLADHPALEQIYVTSRQPVDEVPSVLDLIVDSPDLGERDTDERSGEEVAVLLYTSGTSGRPRGAMLPARALLANLEQVGQLVPQPLTGQDRVFLPLPLFHIFGLNGGLGLSLYFGATLILADRFDADTTAQAIHTERASAVIGAPAQFAAWRIGERTAERFAAVRVALSGSAPLDADLVAWYGEIGVPLYEGYGLTETSPVLMINLIGDGTGAAFLDPKPGSVGRPLPGVTVRLVDPQGEEAEPGDLGMIEARGDNLFTGYWPDGADGPDADGWFSTGDLAVSDDEGDYYLVGRRTDLILVNGFNVYPAEVEAVIGKLDGVREVAVMGLPDPDGDVVVAYVVAQSDAVLDPDNMLVEASRSLARFKLPRRIIEVDSLPHTVTGKVMKWRLPHY